MNVTQKKARVVWVDRGVPDRSVQPVTTVFPRSWPVDIHWGSSSTYTYKHIHSPTVLCGLSTPYQVYKAIHNLYSSCLVLPIPACYLRDVANSAPPPRCVTAYTRGGYRLSSQHPEDTGFPDVCLNLSGATAENDGTNKEKRNSQSYLRTSITSKRFIIPLWNRQRDDRSFPHAVVTSYLPVANQGKYPS